MSEKDENVFKVEFPFKHMNKDYNEVSISGKNIVYAEITDGYGMQLNEKGEAKREKVRKVCVEISEKFKELDKLIND